MELTDALMVCGSTPTEGTIFLFWGVVLLFSSFLSLVSFFFFYVFSVFDRLK